MRDRFIARLCELAAEEPRITLVTGDLGFKVLDGYRASFPNRFINAGVAEQNMTAIATGLALEGRIVFTYSIGNFSTLRCLEQIRNDACYHEANVKVVSVGGGFSYGPLGISHHATEDLAIMRSLPNLTVLAPCGYWETVGATEALVQTPGTGFLRLDKSAGDDAPRHPGERFELGRARVLREGDDAAIIVTGGVLGEVWRASELLADRGVSVRIVSVHSLVPFDHDTIATAARETGAVVTVEEHGVRGGLGGAVAESLLELGPAPRAFRRLGLRGEFSSIVGSQEYLRGRYGLDAESIARAVEELLEGAGSGS